MIMATMSVPPLDALWLKKMADAMEGTTTAKISSKSGWVVSGLSMG